MKSPRSLRFAVSAGFVLLSPVLTFAGGQPAKVRTLSKDEMQDRTGIARAAQPGKGSGLSLSQPVIRASAYRSQTPAESSLLKADPPTTAHSNYSDTAAFHK
jgi:hypothetical protein